LLNLLRDQTPYAYTTGSIKINGKEESLGSFRSEMAFVPQDDIMYDDLTVEENVLYAAVLFNKRNFTKKSQCLLLVDHMLGLLGLNFIRFSVVGSPDKRGISGGQKKRVSVAMELTKEAALFFLDGEYNVRQQEYTHNWFVFRTNFRIGFDLFVVPVVCFAQLGRTW
jgi:ABC-type multidrug transport system ATPase subunit